MNKLILASAAVLILIGAFYVGRITAPQSPPSPGASPGENPLITAQPQEPAIPHPAPSTTPQNNLEVRAMEPEQPSYQRDWLQMRTLVELAKSAPEAALEQARQLKGDLQQEAQNQILANWGQTNPALAWRWLESNQPDNSQAFIALIGAIAITQPIATLDLADRYAQGQSPIKKDIYQAALIGLARGGHYDSAVFLLDYLDQNDGFRQDLTRKLVGQWALYQPQPALEWLAQQPLQTADEQPGRAGTMPSENPLEDAQQQHQQLLDNTYRQWLENDVIAAASWLNSQPPSPALDSLSAQLVQQLTDNPSQALAAAGHIQDPQLKLNSLLGVLSPIRQTDPSQAKAYIEQLTYLNDSQRNSLLRDLALTP